MYLKVVDIGDLGMYFLSSGSLVRLLLCDILENVYTLQIWTRVRLSSPDTGGESSTNRRFSCIQ